MKATFNDFITNAPNYKKFNGNSEAEYIFNNILSRDDNIIAMIDLSNNNINLPALCASITEIENYYSSKTNPIFDLKDNFTKQALGTMVRIILEPFGYQTKSQKDVPKAYGSKFVKSAKTYELTGTPTMKVVRIITEV